jgi:pimeloyl-ACP methyl ester carboxylesterase
MQRELAQIFWGVVMMAYLARTGRILGSASVAALILVLASQAQPPATKDAPKAPGDANKFRVPIQTADFVELDGTYYRGNKGRDTPCVIIVHRFGSDRTKGGIDELARELNKEGFAVLTFDLRGHGGSVNVSPSFWTVLANRNGILRANPSRQTTISASNFKPNYFPWLVNDVAAARRFFEVKNDAGEVNAQSIFVIGAGDGAALGMMFVTAEWYRQYTVGVKALQSIGTPKIAGADIAGAVWLSVMMRPNYNVFLNMREWIRNTQGMRDQNPMCFVFGERDTKAKADAEELYRALTQTGNREKLHKLDSRIELKGTDLSGQALLGPAADALGVRQSIVAYLKKVMAERKSIPWSDLEAASNPLALVNLGVLRVSVP